MEEPGTFAAIEDTPRDSITAFIRTFRRWSDAYYELSSEFSDADAGLLAVIVRPVSSVMYLQIPSVGFLVRFVKLAEAVADRNFLSTSGGLKQVLGERRVHRPE